MHKSTASARVAAVLAASVLTTGFVSSHAMSGVENPAPASIDVFFQNESTGSLLPSSGVVRGFQDASLELYAADGTLVVSTEGSTVHVNPAYDEVQCSAYYAELGDDEWAEVYAELYCEGLPPDSYTVGISAEGPSHVYAVCEIPEGPPAEALSGAGATVTLQPGDVGFCDIEPMVHMLYVGQGALPPYSYTLDLDNPPTLHLSHQEMDTVSLELGSEYGAAGNDVAACLTDSPDEFIGYFALCMLGLSGQFTVGTDIPDGIIAGPLYCLTLNDLDALLDAISAIEDEEELAGLFAFVQGSTIAVTAPGLTLCVQYVGTGVPIYVDVTGDDLTAEDLAGITVEAYDKDGTLVATATDPSLDTCSPVEGTDLPEGATGLVVADSSACAVLWVKPPFALTSGLDEVATETYTLGISGAKVDTHTLVSTDLTWSSDDWYWDIGGQIGVPGAFDEALEGAAAALNAHEPLGTATITLSADATTGSFSSGALTTLDVALAADADDDADADGDETLPETGVSASALLSWSLIVLGAGAALLIARRRLS